MEPTVYCPDCGMEIPETAFVAHREREHPPSPTRLAVSGIRSQEAVHGPAPDHSEET